jgi:hypothetical protein
MKKPTRKFAVVFGAVLLYGCQNPYPTSGGGQISAEPAPSPGEVVPPLVLRVPEFIEAAEGSETVINIEARVKDGDQPIVRVGKLPSGAVYDAAKSVIRWTPAFDAANDSSNSETVSQQYGISISLHSAQDPITVLKKEIKLFVRDTPRAFTISAGGAMRVSEGALLSRVITLESVDFPNGPFKLEAQGLPLGSELKQRNSNNPREYLLTYTPDARAVIRSGYGDSSKSFQIKFIATSSRGLRTEALSTLTVDDDRETPMISAPAEIVQGTNVSFSVSAEDLNGESEPSVKLSGSAPFGVISVVRNFVRDQPSALFQPNPSAQYSITWKGIPEDQIGKSANLGFSACGGYDLLTCRSFTVRVRFEQESFSPPVVDRAKWILGSIRYLKAKQQLEVDLPVRPGDSNSRIYKTEILPSTSEITWTSNKLRITPSTTGVKQFNLRVTSSNGTVVSESFIYEALPESWSDTLVAGLSPSAPAEAAILKAIPGAQFMNPEFQTADTRMLAFRKRLLVSSGVFRSLEARTEIDRMLALVQSVVVLGPKLADAGPVLRREMDDLALRTGSLIAPGTGGEPSFSGFELNPTLDAKIPDSKKPMRLKGTLHSDSAYVQAFYSGQSADCKDAFLFESRTPSRVYPVAVQCTRKAGGGFLMLAGFDFGDLLAETEDAGLPNQWLKDWSNK